MVIGLACYEFINNDVKFNISQIEKALQRCQNVDLLCFGEAFLQGFDAFCWDYNVDKTIAVSQNSAEIQQIEQLSKRYATDIAFGYLEKDCDKLYSSYAVIVDGKLAYNYRRISIGWKEYTKTDDHYAEGNCVLTFPYKERSLTVALCGDVWEFPQKFQNEDILIWPVYVDFSLQEWKTEESDYAKQAQTICNNVLMVNSLLKEPPCHGGCFYFSDGTTKKKLSFDTQDVLTIEI